MMTAKEIAERINATGNTYYGERARSWDGDSNSRIYFGRDYVTIERNGDVHANKDGKVRAQTAGQSAVELVEEAVSG